MNSPAMLAAFRAASVASPVDVHTLGDERQQVLWALGILKVAAANEDHKASDIVRCLRDVSGIEISRQQAQRILEVERGRKTVSRKLIAGAGHYKIMRAGEDVVNGSRIAARFVDPASALDEIRALENILSTFRGTLRVCDPYIDNRTLDYLAECKAATEIRLLTMNVQDINKVRRDLTAFKNQHAANLEIKVLAGGILHDRYIVHDDGLLVLGGSLNGFAKKQMFVIGLGADFAKAVSKAFDANWARAPAF